MAERDGFRGRWTGSPAPTAEQRAQSGGRGWAGRGPLQRGPGSSPWQLILMPGHTQASGLGRGDSRERTPHQGPFYRVTQPQDGPPGGRQWWFVSAESLPAGVWPWGLGVWCMGEPSEPQSLSLYNGFTFWKVHDRSWLERLHWGR